MVQKLAPAVHYPAKVWRLWRFDPTPALLHWSGQTWLLDTQALENCWCRLDLQWGLLLELTIVSVRGKSTQTQWVWVHKPAQASSTLLHNAWLDLRRALRVHANQQQKNGAFVSIG